MSTTLELPAVNDSVREFVRREKKLFIGGKWVNSVSGKTFPVFDPATGEKLCVVPEGGPEDVEAAVSAARQALERWRETAPAQRAELIWRLGDKISEHAEELAQIEALNVGKPVYEALMGDVPGAADHFHYYAGWPTKWTGETLNLSFPGKVLAYTRREPVGVVAAIVPWNFPLMILSWKLAPALAAGNTVIIKPASYTPLSALRLVELAEEVGFPSGVINIVTGPGSTVGMALAEHKGVNKVSFTGSTETGREIMRAAAGNFKRLSLELGGKTANIIFPDADMGMAVGGAFMGIFMNQGEVCVAGSRLFVPKAHFDEVISALTERASEINQGPGVDPTVTMGPLISKSHMDRVMSYIEKGKAEGAELVLGGETNPAAGPGYFVKPTIFVGRDDMTIAREEIFGPVLTALPFEDIDDVVRRANASPYGLGAAVWTKDVAKGIEVAHRLEAGSVWVNGFGIMDSSGAWGGFKESGMGREMGRYAMEAFTEVKFVGVNLG